MMLCAALRAPGAVEISLDNFRVKGNQSSNSIGYVDIEKILPITRSRRGLQDEFNAEVDKRKQAMTRTCESHDDLQTAVKSSSTMVTQMQIELESMKSKPQFTRNPAVHAYNRHFLSDSGILLTVKLRLTPRQWPPRKSSLRTTQAGIDNMRLAIAKQKKTSAIIRTNAKKEITELEKKQTDGSSRRYLRHTRENNLGRQPLDDSGQNQRALRAPCPGLHR